MNQFLSFALFLILSVSYGQPATASAMANDHNLKGSESPDHSNVKSKSGRVVSTSAVKEMTAASNQHFLLSEDGRTLQFRYKLPAWTYTAIFLIKDMTGRVVKSLHLEQNNADKQAIPVNYLMQGVYQYSLLVDDSRKVHGSFELPE